MNPACISERGGGATERPEPLHKKLHVQKRQPKIKTGLSVYKGRGGGQYNPACILEREGEKEKSEVEMGVRLEF